MTALRTFHHLTLALLLGLSLSFYGCSDSNGDTDNGDTDNGYTPNEDCNPAGESVDCFYPFPSDAFRVQSEDKARIEFPEGARLIYGGDPLELELQNPIDGYSTHSPIFADLGEVLDEEQLIFHTDDLSKTTQSNSPALVINAETGEAVAHFMELDHSVSSKQRTLLQIRLLKTLDENTRYIVALQGLKNSEGETIDRLQSFDKLAFANDYKFFTDAQIHTRENILPQLENFGVNLDDVQLAWDFTTRTNRSARYELESMIAQSVEWMDDNSFNITSTDIVRFEDPYDPDLDKADPTHEHLYYDIRATVDVPLFLSDETPEGRMLLDDNGVPRYQDTYALPFDILIPRTVVEEGNSVGTIQFGHGFFGSTDEMRGSFLPEFLNTHQMVAVGIDWWGLSNQDQGPVAGKLSGTGVDVFNFTERLQQSFVNQTVLARAARQIDNSFTGDLEGDEVPLGTLMQNDHHAFYGISLGHILGSTAIAVSPEIENGILSVGGGSFSFIMSRAKPFAILMTLVNAKIARPKDAQKFVAMASIAMEKIDPMTYADQLLKNDFDGGETERRILAQVGLGDPDVPTLSSIAWARSAGIPIAQLAPDYFAADFDVETTTLPEEKSLMMIFDFELEGEIPGTYAKFPSESNEVHGGVRAFSKGQTQVKNLILNEPISDVCNGEVCIVE